MSSEIEFTGAAKITLDQSNIRFEIDDLEEAGFDQESLEALVAEIDDLEEKAVERFGEARAGEIFSEAAADDIANYASDLQGQLLTETGDMLEKAVKNLVDEGYSKTLILNTAANCFDAELRRKGIVPDKDYAAEIGDVTVTTL
jgi:hypothetical protein